MSKICSVEGCTRKAKKLGYCGMHLARFRKYGDADYKFIPKKKSQRNSSIVKSARYNNKGKTCLVEGCDKPATSKGYCAMHYQRVFKYNDPHYVNPKTRYNKGLKCLVPECTADATSKGYCAMHYQRLVKYGDTSYAPVTYHGMSDTLLYGVWDGMKRRCYCQNNHSFNNYGGRGIKMCDRWQESFMDFYEDMGDRPSDQHQIDRVDNDGDYTPENCRWVLPVTNARNRRGTLLSMPKARDIRRKYSQGVKQCVLAKEYDCSAGVIHAVVKNKSWKEPVT